MKYTFLLFALSFAAFTNAQDNSTITFKKNELKINGLSLVNGGFDISYEHLLSDESGLGVSVLIPFDSDDAIIDNLNFYISPYYRFYFGKKPAGGFFLEGFGLFNSIDRTFTDLTPGQVDGFPITREVNEVDFALGIGLGGKWITRKGFVGEINFGLGRNLFNDNLEDFVGKIGISLGYRF